MSKTINTIQSIEIETSRLILRPLRLTDAEDIFSYTKEPKVAEFVLWNPHQSTADTLSFIQDYCFPKYQKGEPEPLGIILKNDTSTLKAGCVIGTVGCFWPPGGEANKCLELAFALSHLAWGQGIMPEAASALMNWCFQNMPVVRIQAHCKAENLKSARVLEKLGMQHEGTLRKRVFSKGRHWDMKLYSQNV